MIGMPGSSYRGSLPRLTSNEALLRDALQRDVEALAGDIGERNLCCAPALEAAAGYIEASLKGAGHACTRQLFQVDGQQCSNVVAASEHTEQNREIVIVGAHYDTVVGSPGANDNASGVAALLALARSLSALVGRRELRFVAFANEEPPYFQTPKMGSAVYARRCKRRGERVAAMICLETIGYYVTERGSQQYPFPLSLFYPDTGNFVGFVGNLRSASLVRRVMKTFRGSMNFPSEGAVLPELFPGIAWSDHWAFWSQGYSAIMVTDTAFYRYPHYHCETDSPEKLDYDSLARVVQGLKRVIEDLVGIERTVRM